KPGAQRRRYSPGTARNSVSSSTVAIAWSSAGTSAGTAGRTMNASSLSACITPSSLWSEQQKTPPKLGGAGGLARLSDVISACAMLPAPRRDRGAQTNSTMCVPKAWRADNTGRGGGQEFFRSRRISPQPILYRQPLDPRELTLVIGDKRMTQCHCLSSDEH